MFQGCRQADTPGAERRNAATRALRLRQAASSVPRSGTRTVPRTARENRATAVETSVTVTTIPARSETSLARVVPAVGSESALGTPAVGAASPVGAGSGVGADESGPARAGAAGAPPSEPAAAVAGTTRTVAVISGWTAQT